MRTNKRISQVLTWKVKNYNFSSDQIWDYDVLKYREDIVKKFKKECVTKEEFAEAMRWEMRYQYWSRAEYEIIVEIDTNGRIWLKPWVGCVNPEEVKIDVTNDKKFNWRGFAEKHINSQIYKNEAKVDIWDQIEWQWNEFVD